MSMSNIFSRNRREPKPPKRKKYKDQQWGEGMCKAPVEVLLQLSGDTLNTLPPETLEKLPPERLRLLPPEPLAKLSIQTLSQLPPETLARLPPEVLAELPPNILAGLQPGILSKLHPKTLGEVLPELGIDTLKILPKDSLFKVDGLAFVKIQPENLVRLPTEVLIYLRSKLPKDIFLRLSPIVLEKYAPYAFQDIPYEIWAALPHDVISKLPRVAHDAVPDLLKLLPPIQSDRAQDVRPSTSGFHKPGLPMAPQFPVPFAPNGAIIPPRTMQSASLNQVRMPPSSYDNDRSVNRSNSQPPAPPKRVPRFRPPSSHSDQHDGVGNQGRFMDRSPERPRPERRGSADVREGLHLPLPGPVTEDPRRESKDRLVDNLNGDIKLKDRVIGRLEDEIESLTAKVIKLSAEQMAGADRLFKFLEKNNPENFYDRQLDPIDSAINHFETILANADENLTLVSAWQSVFKTEKDRNEILVVEQDEARAKIRRLEDTVDSLGRQVSDKDDDIRRASERESVYQTTETSLQNEVLRLKRDVAELNTRLERQKKASESRSLDQQKQFDQKTAGLREEVAKLEKEILTQRNDFAKELQKQLGYYDVERQKLHDEMDRRELVHKDALIIKDKELQAALASQLQEVRGQLAMHDDQIGKERAVFDDQIKRERLAHEKEIQLREKQHADNVVHLRERIDSLQSDLVDNSDDFRPATDDSLKAKYRELKLVVDRITEPFNLGVTTIPQGGGHLDPHKFLESQGKNQLRFLLRSAVWGKIVEGFFSSPFGFGALGPGAGKEMLVALYRTWRRLFDSGSFAGPGQYAQEERFELFYVDKEANKWRSATFQSILMAVMPRGQRKAAAQSNGGAGGDMVRPYADNCRRVHDDIFSILNEVCSSDVASEIKDKVGDIVKLAGELALEFGSQRAELGLEVPRPGDSVLIGPDFVDCEDGDANKGAFEVVNLLVSPKVFRVGDGRNDLKTKKVIFPGEIYPIRS
ncbi:hypothetical protein B0T17DRAFT_611369 [Bombardia bombarda]|uniref:Uncharacterized protein n=1 Tax=Bombardia bombarda TaxID=252184 RepID=A0AA40CDE6_9PEZI|nr:hypothetical protein B0T17DRAFT_611369 [Bombardia bombarda]